MSSETTPLVSLSRYPIATALALSLAAAIALGVSRLSYGLLLTPMRADLGWSYLLAGSMNTANALGYFIGALAIPALTRRVSIWPLLIIGSVLTSIFMLLSGMVTDATALILLRLGAGAASASVFVIGGVLATRLGSMHRERAGFLIGLYYGGTGFGIALSALLVPAALSAAPQLGGAHDWQWAWLALGVACLLATAIMALPAKTIGEMPADHGKKSNFVVKDFGFALAGYFMFGVGYIAYMTFVITLLKQQGMQAETITLFYTLLGVSVVLSSRLWAPMLDRFKGGESLAIFNTIAGVASVLPALTSEVSVVFISGLVFGTVLLSAVASTTVLVRHNLPQESWSSAISVFTVVFALGQIIGPALVGWIADGPGGLERGLIISAVALFIGAALASRQKALSLRK
jgi:predicted MFS family arabinose efflux permease